MPSRCALPRIATGVRPSLSEITPVGVLPRASLRNSRTSAADQLLPRLRLYFGWALRGPLRPIGEPGRFQAERRLVLRAMSNLKRRVMRYRLRTTHARVLRFHEVPAAARGRGG